MRISLALLFAVVLQLSAEDGYAQRTRVAISCLLYTSDAADEL